MFEVSVTEWFAAAHQLRLPAGDLEPLHGHNWRVTVTLVGPRLDAMGVLVDFVALRKRLQQAAGALHDRHLNELPPFAERNPSAENVAVHFADVMGRGLPDGIRVRGVEVEETPGCAARYFPNTAGHQE